MVIRGEARKFAECIRGGGFMRLPERNDAGVVRVWDTSGARRFFDQMDIRVGLNAVVPHKSPADVIYPRSVHARRFQKYRNDMEWLSFVAQHPGASREGWGGSPSRCLRRGYTETGTTGDRISDIGSELLAFFREPF